MKILIISYHTCPENKLGSKDSGGLNIYLHEMSNQLGTKGHTVDIFTRKHDIRDPLEIEINNNSKVVHLNAGNLAEEKQHMHNYIDLFTSNLINYILSRTNMILTRFFNIKGNYLIIISN